MRVLCLDKASKAVLSIHESLAEAAANAGAPGGAGNIQRCCVGKSKSAYGYCWAYEVVEKPDLEGEEWRSFKNIHVSNYGRVRLGTITREVSDLSLKSGYREIMVDNERWPIQRLVYHVFVGIPKGSNVFFKDGNTNNPHLTNLEVRSGRPLSSTPQAVALKRSKPSVPVEQWTHDGSVLLNKYDSIYEAAKSTKVDKSDIRKCVGGKLAHAGAYIWKLAENRV